MFLKRYESEEKVIIAVCDSDIIGKEFREGELTLNLDEKFYKGEIVSKKELNQALLDADIVNISGKKSVACAVDLGYIDTETIIFINGIPHAQILKL